MPIGTLSQRAEDLHLQVCRIQTASERDVRSNLRARLHKRSMYFTKQVRMQQRLRSWSKEQTSVQPKVFQTVHQRQVLSSRNLCL